MCLVLTVNWLSANNQLCIFLGLCLAQSFFILTIDEYEKNIIPFGNSRNNDCLSAPKEGYTLPDPHDVIMYEVNPLVFAQEGAFNVIANRLDSIRALHVNVMWFMPMYEQGVLKAKNSPYCIRDYKAVNPKYGSLEDFKRLVDLCHKKGISVIMDWVANHTSWDHAWINDHPEWYTHDMEGNIIWPATTNWEDVADLNFDNPDMRLAMIDAMKYWIKEVGIDGYRCDAADFVPYDFGSRLLTPCVPCLNAC